MLRVKRVSFAYPGEREILRDVSVCVAPGERVVILGPNGSGKSTLARLVVGRLLPTKGQVEVDGFVAYVSQDPLSQLVSSVVGDEVAFGPRNLGLPVQEVQRRVTKALRDCDLVGFERRGVHELSGGEMRRLALAGMLAMDCNYLVLDELTSELDTLARKHIRAIIDKMCANGVGVLEITHRAQEIVGATRIVRLGLNDTLDSATRSFSFEHLEDSPIARGGSVSLSCSHLSAGYGNDVVLKDLTAVFPPGKITLVVGPSGAGKSTLARVLAGVKKPMAGEVTLGQTPVRAGMVGLMFQRPGDQLFADTVSDEVAYGPKNLGVPEQDIKGRVKWALDVVEFPEELRDVSPWQLSGGQRRRVALASVIAQGPGAYIFDEPTVDLDAKGTYAAQEVAVGLAHGGSPVVVVTHDIGLWRRFADGVVKLEGKTTYARTVPARAQPSVRVDELDACQKKVADRDVHARPKKMPSSEATAGKSSWLYDADPLVKVVCLVLLSIAAFLASPRGLGLLAVLLVVVVLTGGIGPKRLVLSLRPLAVVLVSALLVNALVLDGSYDVHIVGTMGLKTAGVIRGLRAVLRIAVIIGYSLVMSITTFAPDLAHVIARLSRPFGRLGFPVSDVSMTLSLTLRLIPEAMTSIERIRCAQEARGACLSRGAPVRRLSLWISVLVPLMVELFARADDIAEAMRERGYTGHGMTDMQEHANARGVVIIIATISISAASLVL